MTTRIATLGLVAFALSACGTNAQKPVDAEAPQVLTGAEEGRIVDSVIRKDFDSIEGFQTRIKALNDGGVPVRDYHLAKAQCWVSFALEEYHENDRSRVIESALTEADGILDVMETGARPEMAAPKQIATVTKIRDDLWAKIETLKGSPGFRCATLETACLEVKLNEAGHDYQETGWRHARFNIDEAERMAADAERYAANCPQPDDDRDGVANDKDQCPTSPAGSKVNAVGCPLDGDDDRDGVLNSADRCPTTPAGDRVDAKGCSLGKEIRLDGVNFASDSDKLLPESFGILNAAADTLRRYPELNIEVAGHTDSRSSDAYNLNLSQRRAASVMAYLRDSGVKNEFSAKGYGESQPIADNNTEPGRLANRRVVLRILN
ncbi:MAG: OmpA family protein [Proteobacteria bacterium]|nr:OmpA family protein [Pseudomonadota bacterium]